MATKYLVIELWGLGDAVIMTAFLRSLPAGAHEITVLCKPASAAVLRPSFPDVHFIEFTAPWTAFRGKYHLWKWPWKKLFSLLNSLRKERFDAAVSVRPDPRDALLMWLAGARVRAGIPRAGSAIFLNRPWPRQELSHRVEDWWRLRQAMTPEQSTGRDLFPKGPDDGKEDECAIEMPFRQNADSSEQSQEHGPFGKRSLPLLQRSSDTAQLHPPWLDGPKYHDPTIKCWPGRNDLPLWVIHCGAGQPIRRWPSEHLIALVAELRKHYKFQLGIIIDHDGAGEELKGIADLWTKPPSIHALVQCLDEADLLIANDSGPGHIAAALGKPVISIFGSQRPEWFRPYGERVQVVKLTPAPSPPLFDSGGEQERRCLVELTPEFAFNTIQPFLDAHKSVGSKQSSARSPSVSSAASCSKKS